MNDYETLKQRVYELTSQVAQLRARIGLLEQHIEAHFDPKPPPSMLPTREPLRDPTDPAVHVVTALAREVAAARPVARTVKDSARNLRRIVNADDDTGQHQLPGFEKDKK